MMVCCVTPMMLLFLKLGLEKLGLDINVFLEPFKDGLNILWDKGIKVYNAYRCECFTLRALLLWIINNFLTYDILSGHATHGFKTFPIYNDDTYIDYLQHERNMYCT